MKGGGVRALLARDCDLEMEREKELIEHIDAHRLIVPDTKETQAGDQVSKLSCTN